VNTKAEEDVSEKRREERQQNSCLLYIAGSKTAFRCECGCNVFYRIPGENKKFECNGCRNVYSEAGS
jgi:hypothetical protein